MRDLVGPGHRRLSNKCWCRVVGAVLAPPYVHSQIRGGCSKQHPYTERAATYVPASPAPAISN